MAERQGKLNKTAEDVQKLSGSKKERAEALLSKIIFMNEELEKLQKNLKKNGWVEQYQNGATQTGFKKSTDGDVYNTMIKNYTASMKQLEEMLVSVPGEVDEIEAKYFK